MKAALYMGSGEGRKGLPVRNERVEEQVIERYLERAEGVGISEAAAKEIADHTDPGIGRRPGTAAPTGKADRHPGHRGSGKMGQWFVRFLTGSGHKVNVCDTRHRRTGSRRRSSLKDGREERRHRSSSPRRYRPTKEILEDVLALKPKGPSWTSRRSRIRHPDR